MNQRAHLIDIATFFPERIVKLNELQVYVQNDPLKENEFFKAPEERRWAYPTYSSGEMGARALKNLIHKTGISPMDLDLILYSCAITDFVNIGIGPYVQSECGAHKATVLQIDTGCASWLSMLSVADAFIQSGRYRNIALVTVTNFVSRLLDFNKSPRSFVLGDGASAALIQPGKASILASHESAHGENYGLFVCRPRNAQGQPMNYWDVNAGSLQVEFSPQMVHKLKENSVQLVKQAVEDAITKAGLSKSDIDFLITHQPNQGLISKWREVIGISAPRVYDTFQRYANLFQTSIPATLAEGLKEGRIQRGQKIALGTFANGGDFAAGAVIEL